MTAPDLAATVAEFSEAQQENDGLLAMLRADLDLEVQRAREFAAEARLALAEAARAAA